MKSREIYRTKTKSKTELVETGSTGSLPVSDWQKRETRRRKEEAKIKRIQDVARAKEQEIQSTMESCNPAMRAALSAMAVEVRRSANARISIIQLLMEARDNI